MPSTPSPEIPIPDTPSSRKRNACALAAVKRAADQQASRNRSSSLLPPVPAQRIVSLPDLPPRDAAKRFKCLFPGPNDNCGFQSNQSDEVLAHIHNEHWATVRTNQSSTSSSSCTPPADLSSWSPASVTNGCHEFGDFSSSPASRSSGESGSGVTLLSRKSVPIINVTSVPVFPGSTLLTSRTEHVNVSDLPTCPMSPCKKAGDQPSTSQGSLQSHPVGPRHLPSTSSGFSRSHLCVSRNQRAHSGSPDIPVVAPRTKMSVQVRQESPFQFDNAPDIQILDDRSGSKRSHRGSILSTNDTSTSSHHRREQTSEERDKTFELPKDVVKGKRRERAKDEDYPVTRQLRLRNGEKPKRPTKQERLLVRVQKVLAGNLDRNASEDSDDSNSVGFTNEPFAQLRALASVLSAQAREIPYEEPDESEEQVKRLTADRSEDGYEAKYQQRLQDNLGDSNEAFNALIQVSELIGQVVQSGEEYQEPGDGLLALIVAAASHGKTAPNLRMVSYSGFYGKDLGDAGWGCGYRNTQMLIAALLKWPMTRETLIENMGMDKVPNIPRLQELLSLAWEKGFDVYSAGELENQVVKTSKWIGTADVQSLFSSLRIDSRIADFCSAKGTTDVKEQLFQFILDYFTFHASNTSKFVPPIYIQYAGHSRTVIGMDVTGYPQVPQNSCSRSCMDKKERDKWMDKVGLLIFDPGVSQWDMAQPEKPTRKWYFDKILCKLSSFKEETYQILYFTGRILDDFHYDQMKVVGAGHHAGPFFLDEE